MALSSPLGIEIGKVSNKYISLGKIVIFTAEINPKSESGREGIPLKEGIV